MHLIKKSVYVVVMCITVLLTLVTLAVSAPIGLIGKGLVMFAEQNEIQSFLFVEWIDNSLRKWVDRRGV